MCGRVLYEALVRGWIVPVVLTAACTSESADSGVWLDTAGEHAFGAEDIWSSLDAAGNQKADDQLGTDANTDSLSPDLAAEDLPWVLCLQDDSCGFLNRPGTCRVGRCVDGACQEHPADDGWVCASGSVCRPGGLCQVGICEPHGAHVCDDGNPCTEDLCDDEDGCQFVPLSDVECDDGNPCTRDGVCLSGTCQSEDAKCDDGNPCTADLCDPAVGCLHLQQDGPCSEGDLCTLEDQCQYGFCVPGRNVCQCTVDDDCLVLLSEDGCITGVRCDTDTAPASCVITTWVECPVPLDPCVESVCDPASGTCGSSPVTDGVPCEALLLCVQEGTCQQGECVGVPLQCSDDQECTDDFCEPGYGCQFVSTLEPCDDEDPCTVNDMCSGQGLCEGLSTDCGAAPSVRFRIASLSVHEPAMCLPSANTLASSCASANGLVDSLIAGWLQPAEVGSQILLEFSPFDFSQSPVSLSVGTGQCQESPSGCSCQFQAATGTLDSTFLSLDTTCVVAGALADTEPPCFHATSEYFEFPLGAMVLPLFVPHLTGSLPFPNNPELLMNGRVTGFLWRTAADHLTIALPMMPAVPLSDLLDPSTLTWQDGSEGWAVDLRFHAQVVAQ